MSGGDTAATAATAEFRRFLQRREAASLDYVRGQGGSFQALVAEAGDASFFPPRGGTVHGTQEVAQRYAKDVSAFDPRTESSRFEIFHCAADGTLGYWTGLQHATVVMKGADKPMPMTLRVTEVFRKEGGDWKIVHRHADMLAEAQAPGGR
jgi:ketosteroid isomerase-like protein